MSDTTEEEKTEENIRRRFAELPSRVSTAQIAWATFRKPPSVGNWINQRSDFPAVVGTEGGANLRECDAVEQWYFDQTFATGENRGRKGGSTAPAAPRRRAETAAPAPVVTPDQVTAAFALLPKYITRDQICAATGRASVNNWVSHGEGFPEPVENDETAALIQERAHERGADPEYRDRKAVLTWYLNQPFSVARRGPKDTVALALAAVPKATRLSVAQLTTELGLKEKKTVYYWAQTPESRPGDPFPPADSGSKREWAAVRSWLLRKDDPVPEDAEELEAWVLRYAEHVGPGSYLTDENGLTMGQRDAVERARVARAAGHGFGSRRLAQLLGLPTAKVSDLLARDGSPLPASHLFPAALAEELGVDAKRLSHFARYYKTGEDPFPPSVSGRGYEVEAARDWLQRRGLLTGEDTTDPQD